MLGEQDERLRAELSLLRAMYPDQVRWNEKAREVKYSSAEGAFQLRLPDGYLIGQLPDVISANVRRASVREQMRQHILNLTVGEEVLDSIISAFIELANSTEVSVDSRVDATEVNGDAAKKATVIVWLHHLLNTNKRKQALAPSYPDLSGVTKPGYPGVLIYSGLAAAVHQHVNELKQLNWQAFQIRFETDEEWTFSHGAGVKEVDGMKDVVAEISDERKEEFLKVMRIK